MKNLHPGDILSYSAGSSQTGPQGYRVARRDGQGRGVNLLDAVRKRWPSLAALRREPLMFINAYPAYVGDFKQGIQVDTYLNPRTAMRALSLASLKKLTVVVPAQPLFAAELLLGEHSAAGEWPPSIVLWLGGYLLPHTLAQTLTRAAQERASELSIVQFYGAAEVDAGCLIGRDHDPEGRVIYYPRGDDIKAELLDDVVHLSVRGASGVWSDPFRTGDLGRRCRDGDGLVMVPDKSRVSAIVLKELKSWNADTWARRTGYIDQQGDELRFQLRKGLLPSEANELEFHDFCKITGMTWLTKPVWR